MFVLVAVLLTGPLNAASPAAAEEPTGVELSGSTIPIVVGNASDVVLAAVRDQRLLDPAMTVFNATARQEAVTAPALNGSALPEDVALSDVQLRYEVPTAPNGATMTLQTLGIGAARANWEAGVPLPLNTETPPRLAFTFDTPGNYTVKVTATMTITTVPRRAEATAPEPPESVPGNASTPVRLETVYTVDVGEPVSEPSETKPSRPEVAAAASGDRETRTAPGGGEGTSDTGTGQPAARATTTGAADPTAVSAGEVRVMTSLRNGELVQELVDFTSDPNGKPLDPANTMFTVQASEAWPGANPDENPDLWGKIAPDHGQVWRSRSSGIGANGLALILDSSRVHMGEVNGDPGLSDEGGVYTRLGSITGPGTGALLWAGYYDGGTSFKTGVQSPWTPTGPAGMSGLVSPEQPFAAAFTAPGRYCMTLETFTQRAGAGTVLNNDVTLTLAVGDIDPATVEQCVQPDPIQSQAPSPVRSEASGVKVIDSGVALLGSTLAGRALSLDVVTTDRGRTISYDPSQVVFSLPNRDSRWPGTGFGNTTQQNWERMVPSGSRPWRTTGQYPSADTASSSIDERANGLALDLEARFIDTGALDAGTSAVTYQFDGVTTTSASGYFTTYRVDELEGGVSYDANVAFWDSRVGGDRTDQRTRSSDGSFYTLSKEIAAGSATPALGTVFSEAGVYCVSLRTSATLADGTPVEDKATFTFAVGVNAATVVPCSQQSGAPGGGGGPEEPGQLDTSVTWMQKGHVDLAVEEAKDGQLRFTTGDPGTVGMHGLKDAVWVARGSFATYNVREPDGVDDRTFIGPVGSTYHGFSQTGESQGRTLWPGISMMRLPWGLDRHAAWTLRKATGPGDVFVWTANTTYLDSKAQTSTSFPLGQSHVHQNWAFTQPGVYCLAVDVRMRPPADKEQDRTGSSLLTVAVGDVDLSTVQPCGRTQEIPTEPAPEPVLPSKERAVFGVGEKTRELELTRVNGKPDVVASVSDRLGTAKRYLNPEKVIFATTKYAGRWELPALRWSTFLHGAGGSDVDLTLGRVSGPGDYFMRGRALNDLVTQFDTRTGQEKIRDTAWPGYLFNSIHDFTAEGVYCIPFTWSGTDTSGTTFSTTKTLTFAAGVDPAGVKPCAEGGNSTEPGGGGSTDPVWDVPNHSKADSGATIIATGHVDVASQLASGALTTTVKDSTDASRPVAYRQPSETVLQVRPQAEAKVPAAEAYRFLGAAGSKVWMLPETEQEGVLWPGWSTEGLRGDETKTGVRWTLNRMDGPGEFALYQTPFTGPEVLFNTRDGITGADSFEIPKNTHAHGSWAFSAEGVYCLAFERSTTLADGANAADSFTLAVAVGQVDVRSIDPSKCFTDPGGKPSEDDTTPIPVSDLHDGNTGGVQVLGGDAGFEAGQLVNLQIGTDRAGSWVSVWLDDASWLGWAQLGSSGALTVRIPAGAKPGAHTLVVKSIDGALIGWDSLGVVTGGGPGGGNPGNGEGPTPDGAWNVPNGAMNKAGATVLNNGHIDIASLIDDGGSLTTKIKDTTNSVAPVWRDPAKTVLQLLPASRTVVPSGGQWSFLGKTGASFYQIAQVQQPGLLWPGWSTESIPQDATTGGVKWTLKDVSGPGEFALYETGSFGDPRLLFNTRDGISGSDSFTIPKNVHAHGSWGFSAPGNYCLAMQRTAQLASGKTSSDSFVLAVAVGTADVMSVDPGNCGKTVNTTPLVDTPPPGDMDGGGSSTPAKQTLPASPCVAGATVFSAGHIDYASRIVGGKLESLIGEDTSGAKVYREPGGVILWLKPSSRVTLPGGYGQIGASGAPVWQVPQTQNMDLIWLGWNTEALNAGNSHGPVSWTVNRVDGPGSVKVYLSGAFGGVQQMVFNSGGRYQIPQGVHGHANWAFSAEGIYRISMTQTTTLANGQTSSDTETLTIAVGNVNPASAATGGSGCGTVSNAMLLSDNQDAAKKAAEQAAAAAAIAARDQRPGEAVPGPGFTNPFTSLADGDPVPLLLSILGTLLLAGAAGAGTLWWRGRRQGIA